MDRKADYCEKKQYGKYSNDEDIRECQLSDALHMIRYKNLLALSVKVSKSIISKTYKWE